MNFVEVTNHDSIIGKKRILFNVNAIEYIRLEPEKPNLYRIILNNGAIVVSGSDLNRILSTIKE